MDSEQNIYQWFALGAPYRNELKVYEALCNHGIKSWVPVIRIQEKRLSRKVWVNRPAIGNLLFAYSTEKQLLAVKPFIPRMQFKVFTEDGASRKVTVPDREMENFMLFISKLSAMPEFIDTEKLNLKAGDRVKVVSGPFEGVEGTFVRLKGSRSRRLCISLQKLGTALIEIAPESVQVLQHSV